MSRKKRRDRASYNQLCSSGCGRRLDVPRQGVEAQSLRAKKWVMKFRRSHRKPNPYPFLCKPCLGDLISRQVLGIERQEAEDDMCG